jgi:hypothetical protein
VPVCVSVRLVTGDADAAVDGACVADAAGDAERLPMKASIRPEDVVAITVPSPARVGYDIK